MKYPATPPRTDAMVQTSAWLNHFARSDSTIGISMMSGGIGKNELSANDTPASAQGARRWPARFMVQS